MQQYNYEVRHLSGVLNAEADSMSRIFEHLHLSNLFATAPSTEQADLERKTGVIASSTRLCGNSEADFEHCEEGEEEGPDGEGGLDSALFSAHLASENFSQLEAAAMGVLKSNGERAGPLSAATCEALRSEGRADWTMFCKSNEEEALADAAEATWEESADQPADEGCHATLQVNEAENLYSSLYGIGDKLYIV